MIAKRAIAGTANPTVAPPLKAIANVLPRPSPLRFAALTAAFTVIFNEIIPATADNAAPTAKAIPFDGCKNAPIITDSAIATGMIIFISRFRNADAPSLTAFEISIISLVPEGCLVIQATNPPATKKETIPQINGRISAKSIVISHFPFLINIHQKERILLLFLYAEKVFPRSPCRTNLLNRFPCARYGNLIWINS